MYARVARFEGVDVAAAKSTMDEAEAVLRPMMEALPGYGGELMLLAEDGTFLAVTLFDSQANAEAAEPTFDQEMPAKLGHLFRQWAGTRTAVERFEVAVDSRP